MAKRIQRKNNKRPEINPALLEEYYSRGQGKISDEEAERIKQMRNEIIEEIFLLAKILGKDISSLIKVKDVYSAQKTGLEEEKTIVISPNGDLKAALYYLHSLYYDYMLTMPEEIAYLQSHEYLTNDNLNMKSYERMLIKWGYPNDIFKGKNAYIAKKIFTHASNRRWKIAKELERIEQTYNTFDGEDRTADYYFFSKDKTDELEEYLEELKDALTVKHPFS